MYAVAFPAIDPTLVEIGPFAIRWYALAYIAGILLGWRYALHLSATSPAPNLDRKALDDFLLWATLGIVVGGRLGYVVFYQAAYFIDHPIEALYVWQGGMSFHGGMLGVAVVMVLFARKRGIPVLGLADVISCVAPIGLFFGRLANFVNGELYGRATDVAWAMYFPRDPETARHPSQLYEAGLEGFVLFCVLLLVWRKSALKQRLGAITGLFLAGYGVARIIAELFREPDAHLGFIIEGITMGQILSLPMILAGAALIIWARPAPEPSPPGKKAKKEKRKG